MQVESIGSPAQLTNQPTEHKERKHLQLRELLDTVKEITSDWIAMAVKMAKTCRITYHSFRKVISRIFREKGLSLKGYRSTLQGQWYTVA
jgi:hypothetical protein